MIDEVLQFTSSFKDFARPNRFKVFFYYDAISDKDLKKLTQLVNSAQFPTMSMNNLQLSRCGKKINIPFETSSPMNLTINFLIDMEYTPIRVFERIFNITTNVTTNNYNTLDYFDTAKIEIIQYNLDLTKPLFKYTFIRPVPTVIGEITLNHTSKSEVENVNVTIYSDSYSFTELS
jgi:hypothetical protein